MLPSHLQDVVQEDEDAGVEEGRPVVVVVPVKRHQVLVARVGCMQPLAVRLADEAVLVCVACIRQSTN